jgi:hypothetical protein
MEDEYRNYRIQSEKTIADQCREINRLGGENNALTKKLAKVDTLRTLLSTLVELTDTKD